MPRKPTSTEPFPEAIMTELEWDILPLSALRLNRSPVKAISSVGGLKKGQIYNVAYVTNTGKLALAGNTERLFPMAAFVGCVYKDGTERKPESDKTPEPANDN